MFTIEEFLKLNIITRYKNLTGADIPGDRPIEYVSVNDLPLDDFIRKNEMVLSIATPYVKDESLMTQFIEGLIQAGASIFLLAIPGDDMSLSRENAELARSGDLPILMIPWDVRFADICEAVLDRLHDDYNKDVKKVENLQADMLKSFLNGADISSAARIISKSLGCDVSITDMSDNVVGGNPAAPETTRIALKSNGHLYGHLCLSDEKTRELLALLSNTLSPTLSLWFYRDEIIERTQSMARDDLIWSLVNGSDPSSEKILRTAKLMGLNLKRSYTCIVGRVRLDSHDSDEWRQNWIDSNINTVRNVFMKTAKSLGREAMVTYHNNAIIAYLEVSLSSGKDQVARFLDLAEEKLRAVSSRLTFSWGVSEIKEGTTDFRNYYLHAKLAEELCMNDIRLGKRYFYENTLIYNMMSILSSDEAFTESAYNILAPVVEYDKTRSTKLMDTLRAFLTYKNISEVSRKLDRHRQTLIYQLEKIEDLTGMSLKNHDEIFLLEVCMRLHVDFNSYTD